MYRRLNKLYFNSELPDLDVVWEPCGDAMALTHTYSQEAKRLTFDPALKGYNKIIKLIMLHEMIHVKFPRTHHGRIFKAERQRLWDLGAFDELV
jgi:SprT-like family protein